MKRLEIDLLGAFSVRLDGERVNSFGADSARALLAYLAMHPGSPVDRETLANLLWSEQPTQEGLRNLRQALLRLRRALQEDEEDSAAHLHVTRAALQLTLQPADRIDISEFTCRVEAAQSCDFSQPILLQDGVLMPVGDRQTVADRQTVGISSLETAARLYRGDFLEGFHFESEPFEEWSARERENLRCRAMDIFQQLALIYEQTGNLARTRYFAQRQITLEPWREEAHSQIMRSLAADGQRSAALAQYEQCRKVLLAEFGIQPNPETRNLYLTILHGQVRTRPPQPALALPVQALPAPVSSFIGREQELHSILDLLAQPNCRLLTLIGLGGVGKSRLAWQVAAQIDPADYPGGVSIVSLEGLDTPEQIASAISRACGLWLNDVSNLQQQLLQSLRDQKMLLVIDHFDRLITTNAPALLHQILEQAPGVKLLVTSREPVRLRMEWLFEVHGFPCTAPGDEQSSAGSPVARLFEQTARQVQPGFRLTDANLPDVLRVGCLVDGLPLGIEMAAAWSNQFSPQQIADEIEKNLDFLSIDRRDLPDRQRSMRAAFDYSWGLLQPDEQQALRKLAVFHGSFYPPAVQAVTGISAQLLHNLITRSLIHSGPSGSLSIAAVLRPYLREKLESGAEEARQTRLAHARYYGELLADQGALLKGGQQETALTVLTTELDNIRAALRWIVANPAVALPPLAAMEGLFLLFYMRSWFKEGQALFGALAESLKKQNGVAEPPLSLACRGRAYTCQGWFSYLMGDLVQANQQFNLGITDLRQVEPGIALAYSLSYYSVTLLDAGNYAAAGALCQEALAISQSLDDHYSAAICLDILGRRAILTNELNLARHYCLQSLAESEAARDPWSTAFSLQYLGEIGLAKGNYAQARKYLDQSLSIRQSTGDLRGAGLTLTALADVAAQRGDLAGARLTYQRALDLFKQIGYYPGVVQALAALDELPAD
jgi:DNA-binding SARP family transcriptional activator/predicted ATPase